MARSVTHTLIQGDPKGERRDRAFFKTNRKRDFRMRLATEGEEIIQRRAAKQDGGEPIPDGCVCFALCFRVRKEIGVKFFHVPSMGEQSFDLPDDDGELADIFQYGIAVSRASDRITVMSRWAGLELMCRNAA